MLKQNWKDTAEILRKNHIPKRFSLSYELYNSIRNDFANLFEEESEKFDREKFIEACKSI